MKERLPLTLPIGDFPDSFRGDEKRSVQLRKEREKLFPWEKRLRDQREKERTEQTVNVKKANVKQNEPRSKNGEYDKILAENREQIIEDFRNGESVKYLQGKYKIKGKKLYQFLKQNLKKEYYEITEKMLQFRSGKNERIQLNTW